MNTNKELEQIVRTWLDDRAVDPPHASLASTMARVATTPQQRRRWLGRWLDRGSGATRGAGDRGNRGDQGIGRNRLMFGITTMATSAAAVALILALVVPRGDPGQPVIPAAEGGATHVVAADGSGEFSTISEAVAAAAEGDTVLVKPGEYVEVVLVDRDITLQGDGPREEIVIVPPTPAPVDAEGGLLPTLTVKDSDATIRSLTVKPPPDWGSILVSGGAPVFEDVAQVMADVPDAAGTFHFVDGTIATVRDSYWDGLWVSDGAWPTLEDNVAWGEAAIFGDKAVLRGNTFTDCCLYVQGGAQVVIEDNTFDRGDGDRTQPAISVLESGTTAEIVRNTITGMGTAISMRAGAGGTIKDNTLVDNQLGIGWSTTVPGTVSGNTITGGVTGLVVTGGSPVVSDNTITGAAKFGISIGSLASPQLTGNTVCGNGANLMVAEGSAAELGDNDICEDEPAG